MARPHPVTLLGIEQMSALAPAPRDLRDPRFEHDGCGGAFVATTSGRADHSIVESAMRVLVNLGHRGATGSDPDTGDGAGILLQIPHAFLTSASSVKLPAAGEYGVGMVFLPRATAARRSAQALIADCCVAEGLRL